jgi:hypothetical protein
VKHTVYPSASPAREFIFKKIIPGFFAVLFVVALLLLSLLLERRHVYF